MAEAVAGQSRKAVDPKQSGLHKKTHFYKKLHPETTEYGEDQADLFPKIRKEVAIEVGVPEKIIEKAPAVPVSKAATEKTTDVPVMSVGEKTVAVLEERPKMIFTGELAITDADTLSKVEVKETGASAGEIASKLKTVRQKRRDQKPVKTKNLKRITGASPLKKQAAHLVSTEEHEKGSAVVVMFSTVVLAIVLFASLLSVQKTTVLTKGTFQEGYSFGYSELVHNIKQFKNSLKALKI